MSAKTFRIQQVTSAITDEPIRKFCCDCKHAKRRWRDFVWFFGSYEFAQCHHPDMMERSERINWVTGRIKKRVKTYYCVVTREHRCGNEKAQFWESKWQSKERKSGG